MKKVLLYGVIGYTGFQILKGYTGLVYNVGKLSGYMDVAKDLQDSKTTFKYVRDNKR